MTRAVDVGVVAVAACGDRISSVEPSHELNRPTRRPIAKSRATGCSGIRHARSLILDVSGCDGDTTSLLFRSLVDHVVTEDLALARLLSEDLGDGGSEGRLAVAVCRRRSVGVNVVPEERGSALLDVSDRAAGHVPSVSNMSHILRYSELSRAHPMFMCGSLRSNLPPASAA